ncbi:hypothetical protein LIX60_06530 [Streptomyces sp. S07_1.15]|uniref:hypothetical protein n=1 Tax=Streptomyces sp. S07_1.15 TaxID=2873925 RepID=UPI001D1532C5|nr:hypothetical protein [Streptomyces sp. S07_1.15]MCC3651134.1 hypothetical protein [Streptomyces sp. S07_1.15]
MSSSPQHTAPAPMQLSGADAEDLALYREKFRRRLPESPDELRGPTEGVVELPLHMAWSGMTSYGTVEWADDLATRLLEDDPDID